LINVREGITRKQDTLPERLFKDPVPEGPTKGKVVSVESFETMLNDYYSLRGWDSQGIPTKEKLDSLGIIQ
jgi:aldehyde:ferredoxin oxidoreductase